jgi:hypothetical protein
LPASKSGLALLAIDFRIAMRQKSLAQVEPDALYGVEIGRVGGSGMSETFGQDARDGAREEERRRRR